MARFIPQRTSCPYVYPAWFSKELRQCLERKAHLHHLHKVSGCPTAYKMYSDCRRQAKQLLKRDRQAYIDRVETSLRQDPSQFWRFMHSYRSRSSKISTVHTAAGKACTDSTEIANLLASHFSSSFSAVNTGNTDYADKTLQADCLAAMPVTETEICEALRKMKAKKSCGHDGIPSFIVKGCGPILTPILRHIFNLCIQSGVFPTTWKHSIVAPIFKSGDPSLVVNYRPVSLICSLSKVLELVLYGRLYSYFSQKLCTQQHGFIPHRSPVTNLCAFLSKVVPAVHSRHQIDVIYFDLSKAFDTVSHSLLLQKLDHYGICKMYLMLFESYLSNRTNVVRVAGCFSGEFRSTSGVPQGSNLGPLLFLIFINDLAERMQHSEMLLFADDIKIFRPIDRASECSLLQDDINTVSAWCSANMLRINPSKTNVISYHRRQVPIQFLYKLHGGSIARVSTVRDLGVHIDSSLSFKHHIEKTGSDAMKSLGLLTRVTKEFTDPTCYLSLFRALVRSRLEYCSVVWNSVPQYLSLSLERVQMRFVRIYYDRYLFRKIYYTYDRILDHTGLSRLSDRRTLLDMCFLHKLIHGAVDSADLLTSINFHVPTRCRSSPLFYPAVNHKSPVQRMQLVYNSLEAPDLSIFDRYSTFVQAVKNASKA